MQAPGLTRCLFLSADHRQDRQILNQQSPDIRIEGIPRLSALNQKLDQTSQTLLPTVCCQPLGHQRKQWNFLPPIYDQSPSWLLDSCHRAIHHSSHTKQSCAPPFYLFVCGSHPGCRTHPLPEFTGIDLRPRKV